MQMLGDEAARESWTTRESAEEWGAHPANYLNGLSLMDYKDSKDPGESSK